MMALKLVAYGSTAGMVGGIFTVIPVPSALGLITSLYSVYLLFLGIPVMMKSPQEKALPYPTVLLVCGLLAGVILSAVSAILR